MTPKDRIMQELVPMVAEILAVEPEEVVPTARFFEDLGGESIDVLELSFRCEQHFKVKPQFQQLGATRNLVTDAAGRLTPESLASVKTRFPLLDYSRFEADPLIGRITELLTIDAIARYLVSAIEAKEQGLVTEADGTCAAPA